jgi:DNA-directed RNA polymerase subunit beta
VLSSDGTVVELRDSEDDFRASEEFGIDLSRRPGADNFQSIDEV